ncbi:MAG: hypothetical protein J6I85_01510 [Clostridia bacterium]|nr:hypothetical protein [Clostridia bacterium]
MSDTLITVIAIALAAVLMFVFPLMTTADRADDTAQVTLQTSTDEFTLNIANTGKLTLDDYDKFVQKISNPNTYDVEIEFQILDENIGKKTIQANSKAIGENTYYSEYTSQIMNQLKSKGKVTLKEGDIVTVKVSNNNKTMSAQLSGTMNDSATITASSTQTVTTNGK